MVALLHWSQATQIAFRVSTTSKTQDAKWELWSFWKGLHQRIAQEMCRRNSSWPSISSRLSMRWILCA